MINKVVSLVRMHIIIAGLSALMLCGSMVCTVPQVQAAQAGDIEVRISQLTQKVTVLQTLLEKILAGVSVGPTSTVITRGQAIPVGTPVSIASMVRVRADASGLDTSIGTQATGSKGVVTAGPVQTGDRIWYQVDFESGVDGWVSFATIRASVDQSLLKKPQATSSARMELKNVEGIPAKLDYLRTKLASTTDPIAQQKINDLISKLLQQQASNSLLRKANASNTLDKMRKPHATTTSQFRLNEHATSSMQGMNVPREATTSGSVLGASTNVYSEISSTLHTISSLLNEMPQE